jgi:amino acid transporter
MGKSFDYSNILIVIFLILCIVCSVFAVKHKTENNLKRNGNIAGAFLSGVAFFAIIYACKIGFKGPQPVVLKNASEAVGSKNASEAAVI